jgi:hypothetical protein
MTNRYQFFLFGTPYQIVPSINRAISLSGMNMLCPTLLLAGEKDRSFAGQAQKLYDLLKCPKKYILFMKEEEAEDHCQEAALFLANQRIFDWLDEI